MPASTICACLPQELDKSSSSQGKKIIFSVECEHLPNCYTVALILSDDPLASSKCAFENVFTAFVCIVKIPRLLTLFSYTELLLGGFVPH